MWCLELVLVEDYCRGPGDSAVAAAGVVCWMVGRIGLLSSSLYGLYGFTILFKVSHIRTCSRDFGLLIPST